MTIVGGIVVFSITWMVVLFMVLPWGVRSQLEDENTEIEPGTVESAPVQPRILRKFAITTLVTALLFLVFWSTLEFDLIDYRALIEN
jgi:predicted secreted protein